MNKLITDSIQPGDILYAQMKEAGLTVKELAYLVDKSYGIVYAILRGYDGRKITPEMAQKFAIIFDDTPLTYMHQQAACDLDEAPLPLHYKIQLEQKMKDLEKLRREKMKRGCGEVGRKWKE